VVAAGATTTGTPLLTLRFPGVMTPVPLLKIAVMLLDEPDEMVAGLAVKLVMDGAAGEAGVTLTVVKAVAVAPAEFVTVRV